MPRLVPENELNPILQYLSGELTATQVGELTKVGYPEAYRWMGGRLLRACKNGQVEFKLIQGKK